MSVIGGFGINTESYNDEDIQLSPSAQDALFEQFLIDECSHFTDEEREAFLESELAEQLVQEGKMRRNTIVFLSGKDDLSRRTKLSALQMAKDKKDPLFEKLRINRTKERAILSKIMQKYGNKGAKIAKKSQKDWIKNRMPANFGKFGGQDRVSTSASNSKGPRKHHDGLTW